MPIECGIACDMLRPCDRIVASPEKRTTRHSADRKCQWMAKAIELLIPTARYYVTIHDLISLQELEISQDFKAYNETIETYVSKLLQFKTFELPVVSDQIIRHHSNYAADIVDVLICRGTAASLLAAASIFGRHMVHLNWSGFGSRLNSELAIENIVEEYDELAIGVSAIDRPEVVESIRKCGELSDAGQIGLVALVCHWELMRRGISDDEMWHRLLERQLPQSSHIEIAKELRLVAKTL